MTGRAAPTPLPGVVDRRPARTTVTTYAVTLTPVEDRTLVTILERRWMGGHPTSRQVGSFSVDAAEKRDWALGGPLLLPQVLRAVAEHLDS